MKMIIYPGICILCLICILQGIRLHSVKKQLSEWLAFLKSVKTSPMQKHFVKGNGLLAKINYEMNDILEENRKQLIRSAKAEEASKQILTNLSHDVRTPLASLTGYLEALAQNNVNIDEEKEYIRIAYQKSSDLKELIDILFDWFKLNSDKQNYHIKSYDINELTRQILIGWLPVIEQKNIRPEIRISDEEWLSELDKIAYERILNNLLSNAIKHGKCSELLIQTQKTDNMVTIEITNNGITIPETELPFLFDRLYKPEIFDPQYESGISNDRNGLGLSIVKELTNAMHGSVSVQSRDGKTSFYLSFVRKK